MLEGRPIPVYGDGSTRRDYTFVGDIVGAFQSAISYAGSPYEVLNISNERTVTLLELVAGLEEAFSVKAKIAWLPEQAGDVPQTWADISRARELLGYSPATTLEQGLASFADWFVETRERFSGSVEPAARGTM